MKYLSFPGLGIAPFHIDDVAFTVFGLGIKWYAILITCGMILGFLYCLTRAKYEGLDSDDLYDVAIFTVIFGVIGARLYYVLFSLDKFIVTDGDTWSNIKESLLRIINIRSGGLAIYGSLIAGAITIILVCRHKHIRVPVMLDIIVGAVLIGQVIGRWGNFINVEAFGGETALPWRMGILESIDGGASFYAQKFVHPTFLYESLWNLIGFIILHFTYKKKKYNGQIFLMYTAWYGLGRAFVEGLRTDSLMLGPVRISQALGLVLFAAATALLIVFAKHRPAALEIVTVEDEETEETEESEESEETEESEEAAEESEAPEEESETEEDDGTDN